MRDELAKGIAEIKKGEIMAFLKIRTMCGHGRGRVSSPDDLTLGVTAKHIKDRKTPNLSLTVYFPEKLIKELGWEVSVTRLEVHFGINEDHGCILLSPCIDGVLVSQAGTNGRKPVLQKTISNLDSIDVISPPFPSEICGWEVDGNALLLFPTKLVYRQKPTRKNIHTK